MAFTRHHFLVLKTMHIKHNGKTQLGIPGSHVLGFIFLFLNKNLLTGYQKKYKAIWKVLFCEKLIF